MPTYTLDPDETLTLVDDVSLAIPYAFVTDSVRTSVSSKLRRDRRPRRIVEVTVPPVFDLQPGDFVWCSHKLLPEYEPGIETWRLVPLYVFEVFDPITPAHKQLKCLDMRELWCTAWSPFRTGIGMTDDLNGIALLDRGGGWLTTREQVGYGLRPGDDLTWQEVRANSPIVDVYGLRIEGGGGINRLLNSTFSEGSGTTYTNWSWSGTGGATIAEWTLYTLIDANGFRRAVQLVTTAAGEASYLQQTTASIGLEFYAVKIAYKNGGSIDDFAFRVQRADTSEYWQASDDTWHVAAIDNPVSPNSGVLPTATYISPTFYLDAATTLTVTVGQLSAISSVYQILQLQSVELLLVSSSGPDLWDFQKRRSPLPTKAAEVTRVKNETWFVNDSGVRILESTRGFVKLRFRPGWSHADLYDSLEKYLWSLDDAQLSLRYKRTNSGAGVWMFKDQDGSGPEVDASPLPTIDDSVTLICRWTSLAQQEFGFVGQALHLWVQPVLDGSWLTAYTEGHVLAPVAAESRFYLGRSNDADTNGDGYADGSLYDLTVGIHCPTEAELKRM